MLGSSMFELYAQGPGCVCHDFRHELGTLVCNDGGWKLGVASHNVYKDSSYRWGVRLDYIVREKITRENVHCCYNCIITSRGFIKRNDVHWRASSGPKAILDVSIIGGVMDRLSVRLVCKHSVHREMWWLILAAMPG